MKYHKPLVELVWFDAETTHGWETDEEVNSENVPIITVGFLIKKTEDLIVIASSIDKETGNQSNGRIKVPIGMVQSIKELGGSKKQSKKPSPPPQEVPEV